MTGPNDEVLTAREREVRELMDRGLTNQEIAERLGISVAGVKFHVSQILSKLGVASRRQVGERSWSGYVWRAALGIAGLATLAALIFVGVDALTSDSDEESVVAIPTATPNPPSRTPVATPIRSATPGPVASARNPSPYDLYYFVGADPFVAESGTAARPLPAVPGCTGQPQMHWSPDGERVLCVRDTTILLDSEFTVLASWNERASQVQWAPSSDAFLMFADGGRLLLIHRDGDLMADLGNSDALPGTIVTTNGSQLWSPSGDEFAYWSEGQGQLAIYSVSNASSRFVDDSRPLAWLTDETLLVALNYTPPLDLEFSFYEVHILNAVTGDLTRLEQLEAGPEGPIRPNLQAWLSPDRTRAAVLVRREDGLAGLGIFEIATQALTVIPDSRIGYPSESIPPANVRWSQDGATVSWLDMSGPTVLYRAAVDGSDMTQLGTFAQISRLSPSGDSLAYVGGDPGEVGLFVKFIENNDTQEIDARRLVDGFTVNYGFSWRPTP